MIHKCLVSFKIGGYEDRIWCDVIPMNITHILLGQPWLVDWKAHNDKEMNTYSFKWKGVRVTLVPLQPTITSPSKSSLSSEEPKSKQEEETEVMTTSIKLEPKVEDIKADIEKQDQEKVYLTANSSEIGCKTSEMDHASDEIEDKETKILSMGIADKKKQDAKEDKGVAEIKDMDLMNKRPNHSIRSSGCSHEALQIIRR